MKATRKNTPKVAPSDAKLSKLADKRAKLLAQAKILSEKEVRISERIKAKYGSNSIPLFDKSNPLLRPLGLGRRLDGTIHLDSIRDFNRATEAIVASWRDLPARSVERRELKAEWERRRREGRTRVEWWARERRKIHDMKRALGAYRVDREWNRLIDRAWAVERRMLRIPASSFVGVVIKLHMFREMAINLDMPRGAREGDLEFQFQPAISALHDAERLLRGAGKGGAA